MTAANAAPELIPKTATATAIASSKLLLAYSEDPELSNAVRAQIESEPWTVRAMKRATQWILNCFGKLPPEACNASTAQN